MCRPFISGSGEGKILQQEIENFIHESLSPNQSAELKKKILSILSRFIPPSLRTLLDTKTKLIFVNFLGRSKSYTNQEINAADIWTNTSSGYQHNEKYQQYHPQFDQFSNELSICFDLSPEERQSHTFLSLKLRSILSGQPPEPAAG